VLSTISREAPDYMLPNIRQEQGNEISFSLLLPFEINGISIHHLSVLSLFMKNKRFFFHRYILYIWEVHWILVGPSIKYQMCEVVGWDVLGVVDTLSLIPAYLDKKHILSVKTSKTNEIKLPESDNFMEFNQN
jgi:hypothetical protein